MEYQNLPTINTPNFLQKSDKTKKLIQEALQIIDRLGIPIEHLTERTKEKTAMAFLAVGNVTSSKKWKSIKDSNDDYALTTREIISFHNEYLEENISSGSYDDIRRKDLKQLLLSGIVVQSKPSANSSNPTRGYRINCEYSRIIKNYGQKDWFKQVEMFNKSHKTYRERVSQTRDIPKLCVTLKNGNSFQLADGSHNAIQKMVIEEFLPRYGNEAVLLYCGDSDNKFGIVYEKEGLHNLGFNDLKQGKLPDIVAYSPSRDWIYLIEAYHTSNPITPDRKCELEQMAGRSAKKCIFITAFENEASYKNCSEDLAWETEIWIATEPDHVTHRDGCRFLGPYGVEL